jgi:hypothetical protein
VGGGVAKLREAQGVWEEVVWCEKRALHLTWRVGLDDGAVCTFLRDGVRDLSDTTRRFCSSQ